MREMARRFLPVGDRTAIPDSQAADAKPRIALYMPSMVSGGAERVMANVASQLAERDDVEVDFLFVTAKGPYLEQLHEGVRIVDFDCRRIANSLPHLIRYLRRERPAALLAALDPPNLVAIAATKVARVRNRVVVTEHCNFSSAIEAAARRDAAALVPTLVGRLYPYADSVIAVSQGVADDLAESTGLARDVIDVVGNPVITSEVRAKAALEPTHPWFIDSGPPVIMAAGRLAHQKNYELLLHSMAKVAEQRQARLVVFGEGPDREDLLALRKRLGLDDVVDFPGFVDNPYAHMRTAKAFVLSSRFEGLPTVLIEALYCGAAVVSTDCPSGPEEILAAGKYGRLVPVEDQTALAAGLIEALDGKIARPGQESWADFQEQVVVEQYLDILLDRSSDDGQVNDNDQGVPV